MVPLVDPLQTIRSRYRRGYCDWQLQVDSWRRLLNAVKYRPHFLPIDLLSRKGTESRYDSLEVMAGHLEFRTDPQILKRWANEWPECSNGDDRTKGMIPDLTPMGDALREVEGLVPFLRVQGYNLGWM